MGKKSRKKKKSNPIRKQIVPSTMRIKAQLVELFKVERFHVSDGDSIASELDRIYSKCKPQLIFSTLLPIFLESEAKVQQELDQLLPKWVNDNGSVSLLLRYLRRLDIDQENRLAGLKWLEKMGIQKDEIEELRHLTHFYKAFAHEDGSQGIIFIFWYTNSQREKVSGMTFLLDFNPPWEGSIKDVTKLPQRTLEEAITEFIKGYEERVMPMQEMTEKESKHKVVTHLLINQQEKIALPADLVYLRTEFIQNILSLKGQADTPDFTEADFDRLKNMEKSAEELRMFEQKVGRRVRMDDGKELLVTGDPFDEDFDENS